MLLPEPASGHRATQPAPGMPWVTSDCMCQECRRVHAADKKTRNHPWHRPNAMGSRAREKSNHPLKGKPQKCQPATRSLAKVSEFRGAVLSSGKKLARARSKTPRRPTMAPPADKGIRIRTSRRMSVVPEMDLPELVITQCKRRKRQGHQPCEEIHFCGTAHMKQFVGINHPAGQQEHHRADQ